MYSKCNRFNLYKVINENELNFNLDLIKFNFDRYQSVASDLLESVKKMEDSLKRLQRVRQNKNASSASLATMSSSSSSAMSDDDKIRLQLVLDITEFGRQLEEKFNGYKGDSNYDSLYKLVEELNLSINTNTDNSLPSVSNTNE